MTKHFTLIKNARLLDGKSDFAQNCSILIEHFENGKAKVLEIGEPHLDSTLDYALTVYNARSYYVCPGFTDLSLHAGEPGYMHRETLKSAVQTARAGGVTTFLTSEDCQPYADDPIVSEYIKSNSAALPCNVLSGVSMCKKGSDSLLCDLDTMFSRGADAVICSGAFSDEAAYTAIKKCNENSYPLIFRCSTGSSLPYNLQKLCEDINTSRVLLISKTLGARVHISCVTSAGSVELIRRAKEKGVKVSCDSAPPYFVFSAEDVPFYGNNLKLFPPLGNINDKKAVLDGIADGTIDALCSDHSPCSDDEKRGKFAECVPGMIGVQSLFSVCYTHLVAPQIITLPRLVSMLTSAPSSAIYRSGVLECGSDADITVFSSHDEYCFDRQMNLSKSDNSPFIGRFLQGKIIQSFYNGKK